MAIVDRYLQKDALQPRWYVYELYSVRGRWEVRCWEINPAPGEDPPTAEGPWLYAEHMWSSTGVTTSYRDNNLNRPIQEPHTEESARAEFDRWRSGN